MLWDQYETALLIDTCRRVEAGEIARKDAVCELSRTLRARAVERGQTIDSVYRNENGISAQLSKVERLMRRTPGAERHNTRLFVEMVEMFRTDREQYETILAEAKGEKMEKTNQDKFMEWLSGRVAPNLLTDYYLAFAYIESFAQKRGIISGSLYDITNADDVVRIRTALSSPRMQGEVDRKDLRRMTEAAQYLQSYVKETKPRQLFSRDMQSARVPVTAAPGAEYVPGKDPVLDFLRERGVEYIDRRYRSGCLWIVGGMEIRETIGVLRKAGVRISYKSEGGQSTRGRAAWWTKMDTTMVRLGSAAGLENPVTEAPQSELPQPAAQQEQKPDGKAAFVAWMMEQGTEKAGAMMCRWAVTKVGKYAAKDGFLEGSIYDVTDVEVLDRIWKHVNADPEFLEFKKHSIASYAFTNYRSFRKAATAAPIIEAGQTEKSAEEKHADSLAAAQQPPVQSAPAAEAERYAAIIRDNFEDGFRPNHIIDRNRFRQFYEERYGTEPKNEMEEVLRIIRQIGTWQDDRIFLHSGMGQENLLEEILADVKETFEQGATCIYYSELYAKYQEKLAKQLQIYTAEVLAEQILSASRRAYRGTALYCSLPGRTPDADADVRGLLQRSQVPVNYDTMHRELWYIPLDVIKRSLVKAENIVNVAQETYFYVGNLPITAEELRDIEGLLHGELQQRSYVTDGELRALIQEKYPAIAINTEEFTTYGLRNCLEKLLNGHFSFNGPIISEAGHELTTGEVFREFSRSHDHMMLNELSDFAKAVSGSVIYWDSVMDVMTRISAEEFVSKEQVPFDVAATDAVLEELFEGEYMPLKNFKLFLHYPSLPVKWNVFVLESYVFSSSQKFILLHASFTRSECCGAVVRKSSAIKDFSELVLQVLAHSDVWKTENDALSFLVDRGYLQRKHFTQIRTILPQAKKLRERLHAAQ